MTRISVYFDDQVFTWQKSGGISRYFVEIIPRLSRFGINVIFQPRSTDNVYSKDLPGKWRTRSWFFQWISRKFPGSGALWKTYNQWYRWKERRALENQHTGIYHPTYYDIPTHAGAAPLVVTVFDMIHEKLLPDGDPRVVEVRAQKRRAIERAAHIITISAATARDLVEMTQYPAERVTVVHLAGPAPAGSPNIGSKRERELLYVGARDGYKNFQAMVTAIAPCLGPEMKLVCVGQAFEPSEIELLRRLGIEAFCAVVGASEQVLADSYRQALAMIYPSLYEGFGLPLLEAFAHGCPVAVSNISSLPEVAGDAAEYFDPRDETSIREAVLRLIESPSRREQLAEKGFTRLKCFSWEKCAAETAAVYRKVLSETSPH